MMQSDGTKNFKFSSNGNKDLLGLQGLVKAKQECEKAPYADCKLFDFLMARLIDFITCCQTVQPWVSSDCVSMSVLPQQILPALTPLAHVLELTTRRCAVDPLTEKVKMAPEISMDTEELTGIACGISL